MYTASSQDSTEQTITDALQEDLEPLFKVKKTFMTILIRVS